MLLKKLTSAAALLGGLCFSALPALGQEQEAGSANPVQETTTYPLVTVSLNQAELSTRGLLLNGRTLLPIRELVERLDGKVMWDPETKTVWATFPAQQRTVRMQIDSPVAEIYEYVPDDPHRSGRLIESTRLDQPPVLLGGRVVAPVAATAEVVEAKVYFDPQTKHAFIEVPRRQAAGGQ